ncbi:hypothetical protein AB0G71_28680 [Streptomyces sp. NPDC020403]|uniref:hypothetical protein n=1 Tax=unclassified Streptomyces TaxID=2593676 RepID=UPI0033CABD70
MLPTGSSTAVSSSVPDTELYLVSFRAVTAAPGDTVHRSVDLTDPHLSDGARAGLPMPPAARPSKENTTPWTS